jgi:hypothetical protein
MDDDWYGGCLLDRGAAEEARGRRRQESMKQQRTSKAFFLEVNSITAAATNTVQSKDEVETALLIEWLYRSFNSKKKKKKEIEQLSLSVLGYHRNEKEPNCGLWLVPLAPI